MTANGAGSEYRGIHVRLAEFLRASPFQIRGRTILNIDPSSAAFVESFGSTLVARGLLDEVSLSRAQRAQAKSGERFDFVLTRLGLISEADLTGAVADELSLPLATAKSFPIEPILLETLPAEFLKTNRLIPIERGEDRLVVAMADPFNDQAVEAISYLIECPVERQVAVPADFDRAMNALYMDASADGAIPGLGHPTDAVGGDADVERLRDIASEAPTIRLVNRLIANAVEQGASDIHVEPLEDCVRVRYRVDGVLHVSERFAPDMHAAITSRIKIISRLDIAERRLPQDGRIKLAVRGHDIDFRVSTTPTLHGEKVVLRILDRSGVELDFERLGFTEPLLGKFQALLQQPNGIILVTGPTGSGKTTTLYTALTQLNRPDRNICSVEDPVEYQLAGINQMQVQPSIDLTFARALRSLLRQDPDILMIGEIRDLETAQIAIQSSLTGHLVLSTVHTNSASATVTRLIDMGVEDYLLSSTVTGILAQRLVRRLCRNCAAPYDDVPPHVQELIARHGDCSLPERFELRRAVGCDQCRETGYAGRTTVAELLVIDDEIRGLITGGASSSDLEKSATASGFRTLFEDGIYKAFCGETTIDEVLRVASAG